MLELLERTAGARKARQITPPYLDSSRPPQGDFAVMVLCVKVMLFLITTLSSFRPATMPKVESRNARDCSMHQHLIACLYDDLATGQRFGRVEERSCMAFQGAWTFREHMNTRQDNWISWEAMPVQQVNPNVAESYSECAL